MKKIEQANSYRMYDNMGRPVTDMVVTASNVREAIRLAKKKGFFRAHYYGKLKREYNGGVRG